MVRSNKKVNCNISLLKITACIAVVGLHTLHKDISLCNSTLYYLCGFAVPIFLMVSGYFLMNKTNITKQYCFRKICCILRVVILWDLLYFGAKICQNILLCHEGDNWLFGIEGYILSGLIQKGFFWQFWYFGALILLYIMLPVLSCIPANGRIKIVLFLSGVMYVLYIWSIIRGNPVQKNVIQSFRLWTWIFYFMLGGILRNYEGWWKEKLSLCQNLILLAVFTVFVLVYQNLMGGFVIHEGINGSSVLYAEYFYDSIVMVCWIIIIFMTFICLPLSGRISERLSAMEGLTMGVYIIHPIIMRLVQRFLQPDTLFLSLIFFIMVLGLSTVIVWLINKSPLGKYIISL